MNTPDTCLGNPEEQHYSSASGTRPQEERTKLPLSQQKEKCSSLLCVLLHGSERNVKASLSHPFRHELGEKSRLQQDAHRVTTNQQLHVQK